MEAKVFAVVGLGYGDEGKGSIVDYLVRRYDADLVVRFNGGSQAGHNVVISEGGSHCFSQFGSGTFVEKTETYLSEFMLVDPLAIDVESFVLAEKKIFNAKERLVIDKNCIVVTPFHKIVNRMLEVSRGALRYGSCGKGVGQAAIDRNIFGEKVLFVRDMKDKAMMYKKLDFIRKCKLDLAQQLLSDQPENEQLQEYFKCIDQFDIEQLIEEYYEFISSSRIEDKKFLKKVLTDRGCVIFEGAQGVLLDKEYGFYPYITQTKTTFENVEKLIVQCGCINQVTRVGVIRAYFTRHGWGPFITEDKWLASRVVDIHNLSNDWQGSFRIGWFDLVACKYAIKVVKGVDFISLTNFDSIQSFQDEDIIKVCIRYILGVCIIDEIKPQKMQIKRRIVLTENLKRCEPFYVIVDKYEYIRFLEKELSVLIGIISIGLTADDKIEKW